MESGYYGLPNDNETPYKICSISFTKCCSCEVVMKPKHQPFCIKEYHKIVTSKLFRIDTFGDQSHKVNIGYTM